MEVEVRLHSILTSVLYDWFHALVTLLLVTEAENEWKSKAQNRSECFRNGVEYLVLYGMEPRFLGRSACSLVTTLSHTDSRVSSLVYFLIFPV
jgi:hypothetical protein